MKIIVVIFITILLSGCMTSSVLHDSNLKLNLYRNTPIIEESINAQSKDGNRFFLQTPNYILEIEQGKNDLLKSIDVLQQFDDIEIDSTTGNTGDKNIYLNKEEISGKLFLRYGHTFCLKENHKDTLLIEQGFEIKKGGWIGACLDDEKNTVTQKYYSKTINFTAKINKDNKQLIFQPFYIKNTLRVFREQNSYPSAYFIERSLLPLTVIGDIITSPIQLIGYIVLANSKFPASSRW